MTWGSSKGGVSILDTMKAKAAQEQAHASKVKATGEKFELQFKMSPSAYITKAVLAAYGKTSQASGFNGRSRDGIAHSTNVEPTPSPDPSVQAYHQSEDEGKACARGGDVEGAITLFDKAAQQRVDYERSRNLAPDAGHSGAVNVLLRRRASLHQLKIDLKERDPGVVAARQVVRDFYHAEGLVWPD